MLTTWQKENGLYKKACLFSLMSLSCLHYNHVVKKQLFHSSRSEQKDISFEQISSNVGKLMLDLWQAMVAYKRAGQVTLTADINHAKPEIINKAVLHLLHIVSAFEKDRYLFRIFLYIKHIYFINRLWPFDCSQQPNHREGLRVPLWFLDDWRYDSQLWQQGRWAVCMRERCVCVIKMFFFYYFHSSDLTSNLTPVCNLPSLATGFSNFLHIHTHQKCTYRVQTY